MLYDNIDPLYMPTLPSAIEIEDNVIASLFAEKDKPEIVTLILSELKPEDFYHTLNQEVFKAALELFKQGKPLDEAFVTDRLRTNLPHITISGDFVKNLKWKFTGSEHIEESIQLLKTKSVNRQAITGICKLIGNKEAVKSDDLVDKLQSCLMALSQRKTTQTEKPVSEILFDVIADLETRMEGKQALKGVSTGFPRLDSYIGGFQKTRLITLCAQTGIGKTSIALQIAAYIAMNTKQPVFYASMEMSKEELTERVTCQIEGIDSTLLRNSIPGKSTYLQFLDVSVKLDGKPFIMDDAPQTLTALRSKAKRIMAQYGELSLMVVDYLGLIRSEDSKANRYEQVSSVVRGLKDIALELQIPVLCLAQPNRQVNARGDNKLRLSDLKDSGEIEQASDLVIFLNRKSGGTEVELDIAKQRNGALGTIRYQFTPETTNFRECWM